MRLRVDSDCSVEVCEEHISEKAIAYKRNLVMINAGSFVVSMDRSQDFWEVLWLLLIICEE